MLLRIARKTTLVPSAIVRRLDEEEWRKLNHNHEGAAETLLNFLTSNNVTIVKLWPVGVQSGVVGRLTGHPRRCIVRDLASQRMIC